MRVDFTEGKVEKEIFDIFFWCVSKSIYCKCEKVPILQDLDYDSLRKFCLRYYKGLSIDLTPRGTMFLKEKLDEAKKIHSDFYSLVEKYGLQEVKLW